MPAVSDIITNLRMTDVDKESFGLRLRELRTAAGLSQLALAHAPGSAKAAFGRGGRYQRAAAHYAGGKDRPGAGVGIGEMVKPASGEPEAPEARLATSLAPTSAGGGARARREVSRSAWRLNHWKGAGDDRGRIPGDRSVTQRVRRTVRRFVRFGGICSVPRGGSEGFAGRCRGATRSTLTLKFACPTKYAMCKSCSAEAAQASNPTMSFGTTPMHVAAPLSG